MVFVTSDDLALIEKGRTVLHDDFCRRGWAVRITDRVCNMAGVRVVVVNLWLVVEIFVVEIWVVDISVGKMNEVEIFVVPVGARSSDTRSNICVLEY